MADRTILPKELVLAFAKTINEKPAEHIERTAFGTAKFIDGDLFVQLDSADISTPAATIAEVADGDRVLVLLKNRSITILGKIIDIHEEKPERDVKTEFETWTFDDLSTENDTIIGAINEVKSDNNTIANSLIGIGASVSANASAISGLREDVNSLDGLSASVSANADAITDLEEDVQANATEISDVRTDMELATRYLNYVTFSSTVTATIPNVTQGFSNWKAWLITGFIQNIGGVMLAVFTTNGGQSITVRNLYDNSSSSGATWTSNGCQIRATSNGELVLSHTASGASSVLVISV